MPWNHCDASGIRDTEPCPVCGIAKDAWTVQFDATRTFVVGRKLSAKPVVKLVLKDADGEFLANAAFRAELPDGSVEEGQLNRAGYAKVQSPEEGTVVISFPRQAEVSCLSAGVEAKGEGRFACPTGGPKYAFQLGAALGWIELELLDFDDSPVAGEPYVVELPDGELREGTLDDAGHARIEDLPLGDCKVRFPGREVSAVLQAEPPPEPPPADAWLELELQNLDGTPADGEPYQAQLPGGEVREGVLDGQGRARLDDVPAGPCSITFPRREVGALELVSSSGSPAESAQS